MLAVFIVLHLGLLSVFVNDDWHELLVSKKIFISANIPTINFSLSLSVLVMFQQVLDFCFSTTSCYLDPFLPVYLPVNVSTVASVQTATTLPSGMFILLQQNARDLWWHRHTFPVRIGVCSHSDTFLLLTNVHSFTADDVQRFDDGCQKSKQTRVQSFTSTLFSLSTYAQGFNPSRGVFQ